MTVVFGGWLRRLKQNNNLQSENIFHHFSL